MVGRIGPAFHLAHKSLTRHSRLRVNVPAWLWIAAAASLFNVFKAFQIDDTAYLEIAMALLRSPLHAMQARLNWGDVPAPVHFLNQPHFLPAFLASMMAMGVHSDLGLHVAFALFTVTSAWAFFRLAAHIGIRHPVATTALFMLGPQFLPGQNLMTDVPLLAMMLVALLAASRQSWMLAGLAAAAACLTKYSGIVLLPTLSLLAFGARTRRAWLSVAIPIAALAAWSLFNIWDYGNTHILERPRVVWSIVELRARTAAFLVCLGAVTPVTAFALFQPFRYKKSLILVAAIVIVAVLVRLGLLGEARPDANYSITWLRGLFLGNGVLALLLAFSDVDLSNWADGRPLALLAVCASLFVIGWAPFMAVRHLLPVSAVLTLFIARSHLDRLSSELRLSVVTLAVGLGAILAISDMAYAGTYRETATNGLNMAVANTGGRIYTIGHWGWQRYSSARGFLAYSTGVSVLQGGDRLILPCGVDQQPLTPADRSILTEKFRLVARSNLFTFVRTMGPQSGTSHSGYYSSTGDTLPWFISHLPIETFLILEAGSGSPEPFDRNRSCR
jgi:hypothetical protein